MAVQQIILVPDSAFTPYSVPGNPREHYYLDLNPGAVFESEYIVAPHHDEAWLNIHLFKLALHCRSNGIRLVAIGAENQLPFFGMFADAVILQREANVYSVVDGATGFGANISGYKDLPNWKDIYDLGALSQIYSRNMLEHVVANFSDYSVFIREASYHAFLRAELPRDFIWCEIKHGTLANLIREVGKVRSSVPILGLDKQFQRTLISKFGSHFMSIQILSSLLNGARFFCGAGSGHVFTVAPVNMAICVGMDFCFTNESAEVLRRFTTNRFGVPPLVHSGHGGQMQDLRGKAWDFDYFLDQSLIEAFLNYIAIANGGANHRRIPTIKNFAEFIEERRMCGGLSGRKFRMERGTGDKVCELQFNPGGILSGASSNESYWNVVGRTLIVCGEAGQCTTAFSETGNCWTGPYLFNEAVTHILREV